MNYPKPIALASIANLKATWFKSKDARRAGRAPGIDNVRTDQFSRRLDERLARARERLLSPDFAFLQLRATFIRKKDGTDRVICIPTVEDRLIQRSILDYLIAGDKLGVLNQVSYADDFVILCDSERECNAALALVTELLSKKGHKVPPLADGSKTIIAPPDEAIEFLGFDIAPKRGSYEIRVPSHAMTRVQELCEPFQSFESCYTEWQTLARALQALNTKVASFESVYRIATNFLDLKSHASHCKRNAISGLFGSLLGVKVMSLSREKMLFIDMQPED